MWVTWMLHVMEAAGTFKDEPSKRVNALKKYGKHRSTNLEILSVSL